MRNRSRARPPAQHEVTQALLYTARSGVSESALLWRHRKLARAVLLAGFVLCAYSDQRGLQAQSAPAASAGAASASRVERRARELASWVEEKQGNLGLHVVDLETGRTLAAVAERKPLNPASNMKLVTAAAALDLLGPDFSFRTGIYGALNGSSAARLVLRGDGDPSLDMAGLWRLGSALVQLGLRKVEGDLLVDQSRFDAQFIPPAFEQQPGEWAYFRAPVSAVALEANTVTLNVVPTEPGERARVWFDPPGFVGQSGTIVTGARGSGQDIKLSMKAAGAKLRAEVGGSVAVGLPRQRFLRRVDDPQLFPGYALAHVLKTLGVELKGEVKPGGAEEKRELTYVTSPPLGTLLTRLGKQSDNFYAEMIFKAIAAQRAPGKPSSFADAADAVSAWLRAVPAKAETGGAAPSAAESDVITNGSGLFDANRLSAQSLTRVLTHAYQSPKLSAEFVAQLSVGGVDGTLRSRFSAQRESRVVRAKTGTLAKVVSLSGYVLRPGKRPIAFSILVTGITDHAGVRLRTDRVVSELAALP